MKFTRNALIVVAASVLSMLVLLWLAAPGTARGPRAAAPRDVSAAAPPPATDAALATPRRGARYYFDVTGHDAAEFRALLERAAEIYAATPPQERDALEVVLVIHGPDIEYLAAANSARYGDIIALAGELEAHGVFDFKMCASAARQRGIAPADLPPFVELVPWAPDEFERLEQAGYARL